MNDDRIRMLNESLANFLKYYFDKRKTNPTIVLAPSIIPIDNPPKENPIKYQLENNCLIKASISGIIGGAMGGVFGIFMSSLRADSTYLIGTEYENKPYSLKAMLKEFKYSAKSTAKNFGQFSFLLVGTECIIEKYRGKHDIWNEILAGVTIGTLGGFRASPKLAVIGGLSLGAFTGIIGLFLSGH